MILESQLTTDEWEKIQHFVLNSPTNIVIDVPKANKRHIITPNGHLVISGFIKYILGIKTETKEEYNLEYHTAAFTHLYSEECRRAACHGRAFPFTVDKNFPISDRLLNIPAQ